MIKKKIDNDVIETQLTRVAPDSREIFLLADGRIRGTILHGTRLVNEMRANHDLGILETLVLGHAYMGAGLLTTSLKDSGRIVFSIECGGPIKGLTAESDATGNIRGYLKNVPIPVEKPLESFDLSPFFGPGFMSITKYLPGESSPYTGQVMLKYGNVAEDLAMYFLSSEQVPTSFSLSLKFDREGNAVGAGGLFLQVLPGTGEELLRELERIVYGMPSLGSFFAEGGSPRTLMEASFAGFSPEHLATEPVSFECSCSKARFGAFIAALPSEERQAILEEGPFPLRTTCHNCNSSYEYTQAEIQQLFSN